MKFSRPALRTVIFIAVGFLGLSQAQTAPDPPAVASMEKKLQHLASNSQDDHPSSLPTEFTDAEVNAYFAAGKVKLPSGVQSVNFRSRPGVIAGTARVDFDQLKAGRNSGNPLLSMFGGIHTVTVVAHAHGERGQGFVHVDSVDLDDTEIPDIVLQLFVQKFVQPKYSNIGIDSQFVLPVCIDTATVGLQKVTLIQK